MVSAVTRASTLGGNSLSHHRCRDANSAGSCFAGEYLKANYAVLMYELARHALFQQKLNFDDTLTPTTDWGPLG